MRLSVYISLLLSLPVPLKDPCNYSSAGTVRPGTLVGAGWPISELIDLLWTWGPGCPQHMSVLRFFFSSEAGLIQMLPFGICLFFGEICGYISAKFLSLTGSAFVSY